MPKAPIQSRTLFYLTTKYDKSIIPAQWNLVDTSVGICVEPRIFGFGNPDKMTDADVYDQSATRISMEDGDQFFQLYGTGGDQITRDFSPQGF